jgi:hypothetical protein
MTMHDFVRETKTKPPGTYSWSEYHRGVGVFKLTLTTVGSAQEGKKRGVTLSTRSFPTQRKAVEFFRAMLHRYRPGQHVNNEDARDLSALLTRHPDYTIKVGSGIDHFEVMTPMPRQQCFRVVRRDGSGTDFSYLQCISPTPHKRNLHLALREVVQADLWAAKDRFWAEHAGEDGRVTCAVTGERISSKEGHMDHRPPMTFEVIVETFLKARGLRPGDVQLIGTGDDQVGSDIVDPELREAFRTYHNKIAQIDFVKIVVNLKQASQHRLKPTRIAME